MNQRQVLQCHLFTSDFCLYEPFKVVAESYHTWLRNAFFFGYRKSLHSFGTDLFPRLRAIGGTFAMPIMSRLRSAYPTTGASKRVANTESR